MDARAELARVLRAVLVAGLVLPASGHTFPAPQSEDSGAETALFASPTRLDRIGRIVAPVMINGSGPFRFIIDSGASRSTISPQLAMALGLDPADEQAILVNGVTGTAQVPSVAIAKLQAGDIVIRNTRFPVVLAGQLDGADGILGVAGLKKERILIDFQHDRVVILRSHRQGPPAGFLTVTAERLNGDLLSVPARIGRVRARAIIDTGSERTLGNLALRAALQSKRRREPAPQVTIVYGATTEVSNGVIEAAPPITLDSATISNASIVFGDFHIFEVWNMQSQPALIIGMDVLGTLRALAIDFRDSKLYLDGGDQHAQTNGSDEGNVAGGAAAGRLSRASRRLKPPPCRLS